MARKFQFDSIIQNSLQSTVSNSFADSLKMIDLTKIKPNKNNFYSLSEIEILADDIERQGLKHNLVVFQNKEELETYTIISGHRRFKAIEILFQNGKIGNLVPCYVSNGDDEDTVMYDLIMLNATGREISDGERLKQYECLKKILEKKKMDGEKFGRIREKISEILKISTGQVSKIENITNNAIDDVKKAIDNGEISISTANEIAKLDKPEQEEIIKNNEINQMNHKNIKKLAQKSIPNLNVSDIEREEKNVPQMAQNSNAQEEEKNVPQMAQNPNTQEEEKNVPQMAQNFGAEEEKNMLKIYFKNTNHKKFYNDCIEKTNSIRDTYHKSFFYTLGLLEETRKNINRLYDFKNREIKFDGLFESWQTDGSLKITRMAFNLFNGFVGDTGEKEFEQQSLYSPYNLFNCEFAFFFFEAIKLRYPEYVHDCKF